MIGPHLPCSSRRRRRLYPHDDNPYQDLHRFFSFLFLDILDGEVNYIYIFCVEKKSMTLRVFALCQPVPWSGHVFKLPSEAALDFASVPFHQRVAHCVQFSCKHRPRPPPHSFSRMRSLLVVFILFFFFNCSFFFMSQNLITRKKQPHHELQKRRRPFLSTMQLNFCCFCYRRWR